MLQVMVIKDNRLFYMVLYLEIFSAFLEPSRERYLSGTSLSFSGWYFPLLAISRHRKDMSEATILIFQSDASGMDSASSIAIE